MTAWRDDLLEGAIGGAPFLTESISTSSGRRTVVTEFPGRDQAAAEDMGARARRFAVQALVAGDDYMRARDAVVDVLDTAGPHRLRHPYYGEVSVVLEPGSALEVAESATEGGCARLRFTLVEVTGAMPFRIIASPAAKLQSVAYLVRKTALTDYKKALDALTDVTAAVTAAIGKASGALGKVHRRTLAALGGPAALAYAISDLQDAAARLAALPDELMTEIDKVLGAIASLVRDADLADAAPWPGGDKPVRVDLALAAAHDLAAFDAVTPPTFEGEEVDEEDAAAEAALTLATKTLSVAAFTELFQELSLESADQAGTVVKVLGDAIAELLSADLSDEAFDALTDLRAGLVAQAQQAGRDLPALTTYTPASPLPALLLAYQLHGDPDRDLELVARNPGIADPNFVHGALEVLLV